MFRRFFFQIKMNDVQTTCTSSYYDAKFQKDWYKFILQEKLGFKIPTVDVKCQKMTEITSSPLTINVANY